MDLKDLMSGIGVVIDDAFDERRLIPDGEAGNTDPIFEIVKQIKQQWNLPFLTASSMPSEDTWPGMLQAASFILLDWRLWPTGAAELERDGIERHIRFLDQAKDYFVPVFIFTNENAEDVTNRLPEPVYPEESPEKSFVFVRNKAGLLRGGALDFGDIEQWVRRNASVYALKTWDRAFHAAKKELFASMYARSVDWPRVFWKAYTDDGVDPSSSLTHLINDSLRGRIRTSAFEAGILAEPAAEVQRGDLQALIAETSVRRREVLPEEEIGCGDLFRDQDGTYLLNVRPDCDCVPRGGAEVDDVELYCIKGLRMRNAELRKLHKNGHFEERIWESILFSAHEGISVRFDFRKFRVQKFSELKDQRIGRLLHPYLTRIQQRFGVYLQRQGLPRIPEAAIPPEPQQAQETEP